MSSTGKPTSASTSRTLLPLSERLGPSRGRLSPGVRSAPLAIEPPCHAEKTLRKPGHPLTGLPGLPARERTYAWTPIWETAR